MKAATTYLRCRSIAEEHMVARIDVNGLGEERYCFCKVTRTEGCIALSLSEWEGNTWIVLSVDPGERCLH